jgi:hypothetical protein
MRDSILRGHGRLMREYALKLLDEDHVAAGLPASAALPFVPFIGRYGWNNQPPAE